MEARFLSSQLLAFLDIDFTLSHMKNQAVGLIILLFFRHFLLIQLAILLSNQRVLLINIFVLDCISDWVLLFNYKHRIVRRIWRRCWRWKGWRRWLIFSLFVYTSGRFFLFNYLGSAVGLNNWLFLLLLLL